MALAGVFLMETDEGREEEAEADEEAEAIG
jgi:hypothetical protein